MSNFGRYELILKHKKEKVTIMLHMLYELKKTIRFKKPCDMMYSS